MGCCASKQELLPALDAANVEVVVPAPAASGVQPSAAAGAPAAGEAPPKAEWSKVQEAKHK
eukprot:2027770-Prymnesium_polylepis.1